MGWRRVALLYAKGADCVLLASDVAIKHIFIADAFIARDMFVFLSTSFLPGRHPPSVVICCNLPTIVSHSIDTPY
jgi:hypothetical protein